MCAEHEIGNYSLRFHAELIKIVMRAELIKIVHAELIKIVMRAEHEIGNYSLRLHAELIKIVMGAEHENVNYSLHFRAELKSGFQFNHASIVNEVLNLINL